jgi:hypothetical protein
MEPNQVHLVAAAVFRNAQQVIHALESRFTSQIVGDVADGNRRNRIHESVCLVHPITTTHFYMGTRPDANAASDSPAPDPLAKAVGEEHILVSSASSDARGGEAMRRQRDVAERPTSIR